MKKESLKTWALIEVEAYLLNKGKSIPAKWIVNSVAGVLAAFAMVKIIIGCKDPRAKELTSEDEHRKYSRLASHYMNRNLNQLNSNGERFTNY